MCSALAGCGSVAASQAAAPATSATPAGSAAGSTAAGSTGSATPAAPAVGCASVDQATSVTVRRAMHLVEPTRVGALSLTQRKTALVRALFGQFCDAVGHADTHLGTVHCPADFGVSYSGTFYDGRRALATFVYGASGCQTVSLTAGGTTRSTMVAGSASAAAPQLRADMAAVLGVPASTLAQPQSQVNQAGPNKPLR